MTSSGSGIEYRANKSFLGASIITTKRNILTRFRGIYRDHDVRLKSLIIYRALRNIQRPSKKPSSNNRDARTIVIGWSVRTRQEWRPRLSLRVLLTSRSGKLYRSQGKIDPN